MRLRWGTVSTLVTEHLHMKTFRAVAMYFDAEISEGFGSTKREAIREAVSQIGAMYPREEVTFEIHVEDL